MNAPNAQRKSSLPEPFSKFYDRLITLPERENSIPLDAAGIWQWLSTYAQEVSEEKRAIFHKKSRATEPVSTDTFHDLCQVLGITPVVGLTYYNTAKICRLTTADIWETMIRMAGNPLKYFLEKECGISGEFATTDISKGRGSNVFKLQGALSTLGIKSYVSFLPMTSVSDDYFDALEVGLPPRKPPKPKIPEKKDHVPQTHPRRQRAVPPRETPTRCSRVTQFENLIARIPRCSNNSAQTSLEPVDMFKGMLSLVPSSMPQDLPKDTRESIFIAVSNALEGKKTLRYGNLY